MGNKKKTGLMNFGVWGWFLVFMCVIYQMMYSAFAVDGMNIFTGYLSGKLGVDNNALLAVATPIGVICCLAGVIFTTLVYKKGTKIVAVTACFAMAVFVGLFGHVTNFTNYVIGLFFIQMAGTCLAFAVHHGFVGTWFPKKKGVVMGWTTMGLPLTSMIIVPFMTGAIGEGGIGWTNYCYVLAVILIAAGILTAVFLTNSPEEKGKYPDNIQKEETVHNENQQENFLKYFQSSFTVVQLLKNKTVWKICIGFGIPWMTTAGVMSQLIVRLMSTGNFDNQMQAVRILQLATIVGLIGSFCWGWLDTRIGTKKAGVIYNFAYVVILVILIFLDHLPVQACYIVTCCLTFTAGGIPNLMPSMVISKFGRYEFLSANRVCTPLATIFQSFGFAVLAGGLALGGWKTAYSIFIVLCLIGAFMIHGIDETKEADDQEIEDRLKKLAAEHAR